MFKVLLNSCGSINIGENPYKEVDGVPRILKECKSIEECQEQVLNYIKKYNLRSSQWLGGQIFDEDGEYLGNISYNGRYWLKE